MLERFFKSQVATVSDSTYCHRITDALTAAGIKCYALAIVIGGVPGILFKRFLKERYQDTIIKATGFSVVFLGAAGTLSKILTVRPDGTLSTGGSMVMILSLALGALLGELIDLDAQFERFGEWLKHKTGSDGDFMNRNLTRSVIV